MYGISLQICLISMFGKLRDFGFQRFNEGRVRLPKRTNFRKNYVGNFFRERPKKPIKRSKICSTNFWPGVSLIWTMPFAVDNDQDHLAYRIRCFFTAQGLLTIHLSIDFDIFCS